jgi:uncharacterized protein (DUF2141 family)
MFARVILTAALVALLSSAIQAQDSGTSLTIRIENVSAKGGVLRLGLYDRAAYPDDNAKPAAFADVPVQAGESIVTLKNLTPGVYALEMFQDINGNGKMDQSWIGLPLEPFGFSRDARPFLGKPGFDDVKFTLAPGENGQNVHLQHFLSLVARK